MLKLRYTPLSPFARKVRVFAAEALLADRLQLDPCDVWAPDCDIVRDNPLGKVPTLLTDDGVFVGSTLCCEYLDTLHDGRCLIPRDGPDRWRILQLHALADGVMEAAVADVTERLRRPAQFVYPGWLERQRGKIARTLALIGSQYGPPADTPDIATITLGCALGYLDLRLPDLHWRTLSPALAGWYAKFSARRSMLDTQPRLQD
jgi:glutathione S-transferase